jgi:hypothetical protein
MKLWSDLSGRLYEPMLYTDFLNRVDAAVQNRLQVGGFSRSRAGFWKRKHGDDINVLSFQKHSSTDSFCVNLGIHYTFLPVAGTEAPLDVDRIEFPDCEVHRRLTADRALGDQWWPLSSESVAEIARLIDDRALETFDSFRADGPIAAISPNDIEQGNLGILSSLTKVCACLLLARMHGHFGDHEKCREAATVGLRVAGAMAVGPKKALRHILARCP